MTTTQTASVAPFVPALSSPSALHCAAKRIIDIVGASAAIIAFSPVLAASAFAIRRGDGGPVLFKQERIGQHEAPFDIFKLRTMTVDNDDSEHRAYATALLTDGVGNEAATDDGVFKLTNDPRVTPAGQFLRRYSIDELPQLFNVLRGEMSLVGPRPALDYEIEHYRDDHRQRAVAKPGCTGVWQVSGRSRMTTLEMLDLDVDYAANPSIVRDLVILVKTPWAIVRGDGAR